MKNIFLIMLASMIFSVANGSEQQKKDWEAKEYNNASFLQVDAGNKVLSNIQWRGDEEVLEIGCGDGKITYEIAKLIPNGAIHGIHYSQNLITDCCQKYAQEKNMSFEQVDIADFSSARKFNTVISCAMLDWVKEKKQAFKNIAQVCTSDAQVHLVVMDKDSSYLKARYAMLTCDKWKQFFENYTIPFFPYTKKKLKKYIVNAGLNKISITTFLQSHIFPTKEDFIKWLFVIPVQYERIPEERQKEFFNDMIDLYTQKVPVREDGSIELHIARIYAIAKK